MIPKSWNNSTVGALCKMVKGSAPVMKTKPGPYPLITMGEEHKTSETYQLDTEAVCVPMISSFGHGRPGLKRVHYAEGKFDLSNLLTALIIEEPINLSTRYLSLYLNTFKDQLIVPLQTGAANMSLRPERLASVPIYYPSIQEQKRIIGFLDEIKAIQQLQTNMLQATENLYQAMLSKAFAGEL